MTTTVDPDGVLELEIRALRKESEGVLSLTLADPAGRLLPEWEPGAHVDLWLGELVRQYSLCGDPANRREYRLGVLLEPDSRGGSSYVHSVLRPGDLVEVGGPRNHFALVDAAEYVFVAGGIGITPLLPMIRHAAARGARWSLTYGGRTAASMAFTAELARYGDAVCLVPQDERGVIDLAAALGEVRDDTAIYCCGPEPLLAAVEKAAAGWPGGALHVERFQARTPSASELAAEREFVVVCDRADVTVTVPSGQSIMDCLDAAGVSVPSACRDGVCGSCQTRVLKGSPEHRDAVLNPADTDSIMVCVSRAASPELVLDL
ncbi:PDR/VanB family oxidoreductase [Amycolatopsis sp. GM8]|uniref:PDR/VanB family oxidoreductase n=1 Tax=Amycolatopsis sp. GM8 TaxID=2896530 RepID=UPI001F157BA6|nr:PDR/VanB family oxidoreductase [Amycolatopsis sp. GM8]